MSRPDSDTLLFRERLLPKPWVWLALAGAMGTLGVAYGYGLGNTGGLVTFGLGTTIAFSGLLVSSPQLSVSASEFRAGRATLPTEWIGKVSALDQTTSDAAVTEKADPTAHLVLRKLAANRVVLVEITDPADPHPYWLVSTRYPDKLSAALVAARPDRRINADSSLKPASDPGSDIPKSDGER